MKIKQIIKSSNFLYGLCLKLLYLKDFLGYKICPIKLIKKRYRISLNKELEITNPQTLNEKINYINLYRRHKMSSKCADKYEVREYLEQKGYKELLVNLLGVYEKSDEINFEELPDKFVLKATHGSGYNIICKDKSKLDIKDAKKKLDIWLKENFAIRTLEFHYKDIKPRIICEEYIDGFDGELPIDYKVFCFHGEPQFIECCVGRGKNLRMVFYDCNWNKLPYSTSEGHQFVNINKPETLEEMLVVAKNLSEPFDFVRADFFDSEGKLLFGELTFTPAGGKMKSMTPEADKLWGELLKI